MSSPSFRFGDFPPSEHRSIHVIASNLAEIDRFLDDFESALALFDHCEIWIPGAKDNEIAFELCMSWRTIAARDGAMSIYHMGKIMDAIRGGFKDCPTFRSNVDTNALKAAIKRMEAEFPIYIKMRHAVSHRGELHSTPEKRQINSVSGSVNLPGIKISPDSSNNTLRGLINRTLFDSFEGSVISYEISQEAFHELREIRNEFMQAFSKVHEGWRPLLRSGRSYRQ